MVKMISGNHFHPFSHVWLQRKYNFPEIVFLLTRIYPFDPEMNLRTHFHFNSFPGHSPRTATQREREKRNTKVTKNTERTHPPILNQPPRALIQPPRRPTQPPRAPIQPLRRPTQPPRRPIQYPDRRSSHRDIRPNHRELRSSHRDVRPSHPDVRSSTQTSDPATKSSEPKTRLPSARVNQLNPLLRSTSRR